MKTWKKKVVIIICLLIVLLLAGLAAKRFLDWRADGLIEVNGEMVKRDRRGIRGSDYLAIPNRLEELGFPEHKTEEIPENECMKIPVNGYVDEPTGIQCIYEITYTYNGEVMEANFDVINLDRTDNETFLKVAENYLGVCAELPYEEDDVGLVQEWLQENIESVNRGKKTAQVIVGDAKFQLLGSDQDGSCGARTLQISKVN